MRTLLVLLLLTSPALGAELTTSDGGVREVDFTLDVVLDGLVAKVTARQELRATTDDPVEAIYRFALPHAAAIVGLTITPPGGKAQRGAAVDATAAIAPAVGETGSITPDLGLVRWLGDDGDTTAYELLVYPVARDASTIVELTWVAPLTYVDGRLGLRIPARGGGLGAVSGTVKATPPPGVKKLRDLHVGGALIAAAPGKDAWPFLVDDDVSFDVTPVVTKTVATFSTVALGDDGGAVAVSVLRPRAAAAAAAFDQVLFVLDVSTSNASAEARGAMAAVVGGVLDALPDAKVQGLVFDHDVRKVLTGFSRSVDDTRAALIAAIDDAPGAPGADLVRALDDAHAMLDLASTLVVIVTDGVLPTDADADALDEALGTGITVSAVLIAPEDRPVPDPRGTALDELTARHGGCVVTLRPAEAATRAATIAGELGADEWSVGELDSGGANVTLETPDRVRPGGGFVAFGWYEGKAPEAITIETDAVALVAKRTKLPRLGALTLVDVHPTIDTHAALELARTLGAAGPLTALVAVDRRDDLAAARLDLAAKGGTFARIAPPDEDALAVPEVELAEIIDVGARYEIDTAGRIRADLIGPQLLPAAHACFDAARLRGAAPKGTVSLEIEIARGEVIAARAKSTGAPEMLRCLREAAFALSVPSYTLDDADAIYVIRYPIQFETKGTVAIGDDTGLEPIDLGDAVDQPLGDLTQRD